MPRNLSPIQPLQKQRLARILTNKFHPYPTYPYPRYPDQHLYSIDHYVTRCLTRISLCLIPDSGTYYYGRKVPRAKMQIFGV